MNRGLIDGLRAAEMTTSSYRARVLGPRKLRVFSNMHVWNPEKKVRFVNDFILILCTSILYIFILQMLGLKSPGDQTSFCVTNRHVSKTSSFRSGCTVGMVDGLILLFITKSLTGPLSALGATQELRGGARPGAGL